MTDSLLKTHLAQIHVWLTSSPDSDKLWHILTCLRGPDAPSERADMKGKKHAAAYAARRKRKRETVEVIRGAVFPHCGAARYRTDIDYVTLPPTAEWDHFDRHVQKAAEAIGLTIKITEPPTSDGSVPAPLTIEKPKKTKSLSEEFAKWGWASPTPQTWPLYVTKLAMKPVALYEKPAVPSDFDPLDNFDDFVVDEASNVGQ